MMKSTMNAPLTEAETRKRHSRQPAIAEQSRFYDSRRLRLTDCDSDI
jgi:hypothetical protein